MADDWRMVKSSRGGCNLEVGIKADREYKCGCVMNDFFCVNSRHFDSERECMKYVKEQQKKGKLKTMRN